MRNRMASGHPMGTLQQVTDNVYRHIFLLVYIYIYKCETSGALCGTTGLVTSNQ